MKIFLITGANGFIGKHLCLRLSDEAKLRGTILSDESASSLLKNCEPVSILPISENTDWNDALINVDTVIHLAARVHVMRETSTDPLFEFRKVNLYGTVHLARQAAQAGVRRFVFMSTIGVNGDNSGYKSYMPSDHPKPHNPYSVSKYEAELALQKISLETGLEVVIIRAPLVYGVGNPGNFLSLLRIISKGIPLPLASITNSRSLIYVGNLVDAMALCAVHPIAAGKTYLVSDGEDVSTPELIHRTAKALGVNVRLFPMPISLMRAAGKITGKNGAVNQLTGSLSVDSSRIRQELGWIPPFTMNEGLQKTAEWFKKR